MGISKGRKSVLKVYSNTKLLNETLASVGSTGHERSLVEPVIEEIEPNVAINKNNKINVNTNIQGSASIATRIQAKTIGRGIKESVSVVKTKKTKKIPLIDTSKLLTS